MRRILLLWPTIRPLVMLKTYQHWIDNSSGKYAIDIRIAVNTADQRNVLEKFKDVLIVGESRKGPAWASHCMTKELQCQDNPILVLVSDDFFAPSSWDDWLVKVFENYDGAILVDDSFHTSNCITIPIMTYNCLIQLNRIIYHPAYLWQCSDVELYDNLAALGLVREMKSKNDLVFTHRHYANSYRERDEHDLYANSMLQVDTETYQSRKKLPVSERLKWLPVYPEVYPSTGHSPGA